MPDPGAPAGSARPGKPGAGYRLLRAIVRTLLQLFWGLRLEGASHLPAQPPYIIAANHSSEIDPVILSAALPVRPTYLASRHLEALPVLFRLIRQFDPVFVRRGLAEVGSVRAALARLARGDILAVYPEGRVVQDAPEGRMGQSAGLGPLHEGLAFIALRAAVPVVPVVMVGAAKMWPVGARWPRRSRLIVRIGPALHPDPGGEDATVLTARIKDALLALLEVRPASSPVTRKPPP